MLHYEELFIQISRDFHNEINPILIEIDPTISEHDHYKRENIHYKFYIIKDILIGLSHQEINIQLLERLNATIEIYEMKIKQYFSSYDVATGFIYYSPEDPKNLKKYFFKTSKFCSSSTIQVRPFYYIFFSLPVRGYPADCSVKLQYGLKKNEQEVRVQNKPGSDIEIKKGKAMYPLSRTTAEHHLINIEFVENNVELVEQWKNSSKVEFEDFCEKVRHHNETLINDFEDVKKMTKSLIERKMQANNFYFDLHQVLCASKCINYTFKDFNIIFLPHFNPDKDNKIVWLKSLSELHYFISLLNYKKLHLKGFSIWAGERFIYSGKTGKKLTNILNKATTSSEKYWKIINTAKKDNPLFKFLEEL